MKTWLVGMTLAAATVLVCPAFCPAQYKPAPGGTTPTGQTGILDSKTEYGVGNTATTKMVEPYGGQLFCPVTGKKLGLNTPAVAVQTNIGEKKPSFLSRTFGAKTTPGAVIYVCCPACAEKVKMNPEGYLGECIADKSYFSASFTYANAPAQRPARAPGEPTSELRTVSERKMVAPAPAPVLTPAPAPIPPLNPAQPAGLAPMPRQ
jgi:hypothetical protein